MVEFKHRLTDQTKKHLEAGEKKCTQCKQVLPLDRFNKVNINTKNGTRSRFASYCRSCARKYYRKGDYQKKRAEMNKNIMEQDCCDACGEPGADHFWRDIQGKNFHNYCVIHEECKGDAFQDGLIPSMRSFIRPKSELKNRYRTPADLDRKYPSLEWNAASLRDIEGSYSRTCNTCGEHKALEHFPMSLHKGKKRIENKCRDCKNIAYARSRKKARGEKTEQPKKSNKKVCRVCGEPKSKSMFDSYIDKTSRNKRRVRSTCRACRNNQLKKCRAKKKGEQ